MAIVPYTVFLILYMAILHYNPAHHPLYSGNTELCIKKTQISTRKWRDLYIFVKTLEIVGSQNIYSQF